MSDEPKKQSAASMGGVARREAMTSEERSESARLAALARYGRVIPSLLPRETHTGTIRLRLSPDDVLDVACAVLDRRTRVISTRGLGRAMGSRKTGTGHTGTGAPQLPPFLAAKNLFPFVSEELRVRLNSPAIYRQKSGGVAYGYEADLLPKICGVILDANKAGSLKTTQGYLVARAEVMIRAFATVGIIALIDEATGYQAERARDELQQLLDAYVVEEMRPWLRVFPDEFFKQVYRLQGWRFREGSAKRPQYVGKLINEWIYKRLPEPVLPELRRRNPAIEGRRRHRHHQFLTDDTGIPHLDRQIASVVTLMRISPNRDVFERHLVDAFPKPGDQGHLPVFEEDQVNDP